MKLQLLEENLHKLLFNLHSGKDFLIVTHIQYSIKDLNLKKYFLNKEEICKITLSALFMTIKVIKVKERMRNTNWKRLM